MHLLALELENFKSFKGEVTIPLEEGFTAVTGPNGSGKSNIGDAIQFVLGPKSSKSLRAQNLKQLIYNGGEKGRAAKFCKATLVFSNSSRNGGRRRLKVDADEVRLTRTIKLGRKDNINSSYHLNDRPSSATEFRRLLTEAGSRGDGYNIVLQGDVTQLAIMSGRARRRVLEDVAGVTAYDDELRKAGKQQAKVEDYLERIGVLQEELSIRIKTLSKERKQALKHRELQESLENARRVLLHSQHRSRFEEIELVSDERTNYIGRLDILGGELESGEKESHELDKAIVEVQRQLNEVVGDDDRKLLEELRRLEVLVGTLRDRVIDHERDIEDCEREAAVLETELQEARGAQEEHETALAEARDTLVQVQKDNEESALQEEEARAALDSGDKETHALNRAFGKATEQVGELADELTEVHLEADRARAQVEQIHEQLATLEEELQENRLARDDLLLQGEDLEEEAPAQDREALGAEVSRLQRQERQLLDDAEICRETLRAAETALARARGELENRSGARASMAQAVQAVIKLRDSREIQGILGSLSELCAPKDKAHEEALAYAMGGGMNSIVVSNDEVADRCITWLRSNRAGRATFLPLNKLTTRRPQGKALMVARQPGVVGFASELLEYDESIEAAVINAVRDTLIVDNMDVARRHMGGVRMVTLDGSVVDGSGAMIGGHTRGRRPQFGGRLPGVAEVGRCEQEVERLRLVSETTDAALTELRRNEQELRARISNLTNDDHSLKMRQWQEDVKRAEGLFEQTDNRVKAARSKLSSAQTEANIHADRLAEARSAHEQAVETRAAAATALQDATPEHLSRQLREAERKRTGAERAQNAAEQVLTSGQGHSELLEKQVADLERRHTDQMTSTDTLRTLIEEKQVEISSSEIELEEVRVAHQEVSDEHHELDEQRLALRDERTVLRTRLEQKARDRDSMRKRIDDLSMQIAQKRRSLEELTEEMAELEVAPPEGEVVLPTVQEAEASVRTLDRKVSNLGDVNMRAIEQYDETEERLGKLTDESKDLRTHRTELLELAEQLEGERKDRLTAVLDIVSDNFTRTYAHLQPGGHGELKLENPKKPFEGGLEMWARPPGKASGLNLLSGGEKSMAALALIFAIQDYDPSPFYYFDEVDQNLDTFNAEATASLCKLRAQTAQFIMVTLRKVSLEMADHHIGITHAGDGCSRLITDFGRETAIEVGDAAYVELEALKENERRKGELDDLPVVDEMPRTPEELPAPESLGGSSLGLDSEAEADGDEADGTLESLADRADDSREDMEEKLEVEIAIQQSEQEELDARDAEEEASEAVDVDIVTIEVTEDDEVE